MKLTVAALVCFAATAHARNYGLHATGMLSVRGVAEPSVRLQPRAAGWELALDVPTVAESGHGACRVELRDVSPLPGPLLKWVEPVANDQPTVMLRLDSARYLGSHTYRVSLRCGLTELARGLVHLLAPPHGDGVAAFDLAHGGHEDAPIAITPKGAL